METNVKIIGAGPTGLGAAYRLMERNCHEWKIYERSDHVGGLSSSHIDEEGFTWDLGGHVLFCHYPYFDRLLEKLLGNAYIERQRESWIYLLQRWIPYPFQNNIRYLPAQEILECLEGLYLAGSSASKCQNFREWINATFGKGIAQLFMIPYNFKVWATPPEMMDYNWVAERVSVIAFERILENVFRNRDDVSWGPNNTFKYPEKGGTGGLFNAFVPFIEPNLALGKNLVSVDTVARKLLFADGTEDEYDCLVSTIPLDRLVKILKPKRRDLIDAAKALRHNSAHVVGIGLEKPTRGTRCWMYFPEKDVPFYRVTNFSYYSPWNVPDGNAGKFSSLLCETSFSEHKVEDKDSMLESTIDGLIKCGLMESDDRHRVAAKWLQEIDYAYPVPTLLRDKALAYLQPILMSMGIFSRGRFGSWRYEVGNMDHSVMMGVEAVDRILDDSPEPTASFPSSKKDLKPIAAKT